MATEPLGPSVGAWQAASQAFARGAASTGVAWQGEGRWLGGGVRVQVVGDLLANAVRGVMGPLAVEDCRARLSIDLCDREAIGAPPVAIPCDPQCPPLQVSEDGRVVLHVSTGSVGWLDRRTGAIVGWVESARTLSLGMRAKPFELLVSTRLHDLDLVVTHASVVALDGIGVLLTGASGAGKSTAAAACLCDGWQYIGDDRVAIERAGDRFVAHRLYASCVLAEDHLVRFPQLRPHCSAPPLEGEKRCVPLRPHFDVQLPSSVGLRAVVACRVRASADTTVVRETTRADALRALAPASLIRRPGASRAMFMRLAEVVERLPCYRMELGRDVAEVPAALGAVLAGEVVA